MLQQLRCEGHTQEQRRSRAILYRVATVSLNWTINKTMLIHVIPFTKTGILRIATGFQSLVNAICVLHGSTNLIQLSRYNFAPLYPGFDGINPLKNVLYQIGSQLTG